MSPLNPESRKNPSRTSTTGAVNPHGSKAAQQKAARGGACIILLRLEKIGAGEGIRTLDPNLGKVVLYP